MDRKEMLETKQTKVKQITPITPKKLPRGRPKVKDVRAELGLDPNKYKKNGDLRKNIRDKLTKEELVDSRVLKPVAIKNKHSRPIVKDITKIEISLSDFTPSTLLQAFYAYIESDGFHEKKVTSKHSEFEIRTEYVFITEENFASYLSIPYDKYNNYFSSKPEFKDTLRLIVERCTKHNQEGVSKSHIPSDLVKTWLKNKRGYSDRTDVTTNVSITASISDATMLEFAQRLIKKNEASSEAISETIPEIDFEESEDNE